MSEKESASTRSTRDIESELAGTRTRIEHTLERLEDRFRPSAIVDQAWDYARSKNPDKTTTRLQETVARNPVPVVLMGVGLAWLLVSGRDGSVPQADSPLTEGATPDRPRASQPETATDDASPAAAKSAPPGPTTTASGSTHSGSAEQAPRGPGPEQARQDTQPKRDNAPAGSASAHGGSSGSPHSTPAGARTTRPGNS